MKLLSGDRIKSLLFCAVVLAVGLDTFFLLIFLFDYSQKLSPLFLFSGPIIRSLIESAKEEILILEVEAIDDSIFYLAMAMCFDCFSN